jgi:hypothetical protein
VVVVSYEREKIVFIHGQGCRHARMHAMVITRLAGMGEGLGNLNLHGSIQEGSFQP